jgi:hypothetical protein
VGIDAGYGFTKAFQCPEGHYVLCYDFVIEGVEVIDVCVSVPRRALGALLPAMGLIDPTTLVGGAVFQCPEGHWFLFYQDPIW